MAEDWVEVKGASPAKTEDDWVEVPKDQTLAQRAWSAAKDAAPAFGRGLVRGATYDFDDELGAGLQAGMAALTPGMDAGETYRKARAENRAQQAQDSADHAIASGLGQLTGTVLSPANALLPEAGLARIGAITGGAAALGRTEAEDLPTQALDTAKGSALGSVFGPLLSKASTVGAETLEKLAGWSALKGTGATGGQFAKIAKDAGQDVDRPAEVGLELLKQKVLPWFGGPRKIEENLSAKLPEVLNKLKASKATLDALPEGQVPLPEMSLRMREQLVPKLQNSPFSKVQNRGDSIGQMLDEASAAGSVPFSKADEALQQVQSLAYPEGGGGDEAAKAIAPLFRQEMRNASAAIPGQAGADYRAGKDSMDRLLAAKKVLENRIPALEGNSAVGMLPMMAGGAAGAGSQAAGHGGLEALAVGGATALATKAARKYAPTLAANTLFTVSKVLKAAPERLGPYAPQLLAAMVKGPAALMATHKQLLETQPEYYDAWDRQAKAEAVQ